MVVVMSILITGASGLLGSKMAEKAASVGYKVYSGYFMHKPNYGFPIRFDIRNRTAVEKAFKIASPEIVVHTVALTDVDKCEMDKELAWNINVEGTRNLVDLCKQRGVFLIYISTDYVFKGDKGMYKETDEPEPINYYGLTKLKGEEEVIDKLNEFCIARPSVIYGIKPLSGKSNFALWVIEKLRKNESINVVMDQWVSPTLNTNLADMLLEVLERRLTGIYHLAGATRMNRYEFAKLIAEEFNLNHELIRPIAMCELKWKASRPKDSSLDVSKAMKNLYNKPLQIKDAVRKLKEELIIKYVLESGSNMNNSCTSK